MIKAIIVEDEIMARKSLEKMCTKYSQLEVVGVYENAEDALIKLNADSVDLILLDIDMPGMSGLDLIEKLVDLPQVIFTTSNTNYAFEAYEYDITDFLKKPVLPSRLSKAIHKVEEIREKRNEVAFSSVKHEIYVKSDGKYVRLPYDDILYFENIGDYIKAITKKGSYLFYDTMKGLDSKIVNPRFLKIHRSYIINMNMITDIKDNTVVIDKQVIPVSRAYKNILLKSINLI